ncbi:Chemotaxis protein CheW [bioreactor metagenome]|uniref:Chemotaxis protein CheW n=1 Tax=bioreactor metagenome TaxID=1076179 RepID=A0A645FX18_9ZZZZ|nr:chemotaxis protein CheW [Oscillospiraceae bacterium]
MNRTLAPELVEMEEDTQYGRYLTFNLGTEYYGLEIKYVTEIIGMQLITTLPGLPAYIKGIINLRGRIIPVMDVRLRFDKEQLEYNDRICIIVACFDGVDIGLIVDRVSEVLTIPDADIVPPPEINKTSNKFIKGIGKVGNEVKLLLDYQKLIDHDDILAIITD